MMFIYLLEENRNLCEDEPDKAECIREVEEAKGNHDSTEQQGASMKSYALDLWSPEEDCSLWSMCGSVSFGY